MKYLFRKGDGNEGNFPRFVVELGPNDCPYAALKALVANEYIAGHSVRRHIVANIEVEGDAEHSIHATVYESPHGETAFGAAWLTAELQPAEDDEDGKCYALREILDSSALRLYRAWAGAKTPQGQRAANPGAAIMIILTTSPKETAPLVNRLLLRDIPFTLVHATFCDSEFHLTEAAWLRIEADRAVLRHLGYHFRFEPSPSPPSASAIGKLGGAARAANLSPARRSEIARAGAQARWARPSPEE